MAIAVALSVALRVRMYFTPITSDEGGFLAIARAWAHGKVLYRDVWVDRPQGLLVLYRLWDAVSGGSVASLRIMAMLFGALAVVAVASVTTTIAGRRAGAVAAVLVAVTSANPAIEGHIANGELLSGAVAVAGLAVAGRALATPGRHPWLLLASGTLAGVALSIKQSGYEGVLTLLVWLVVAVIAGWRSAADARRAALLVMGGLLAVLAALMLHGALTGWSRWWFAFGGYRFGSRSALKGADWKQLRETARIAAPIIAPLLVAGAVALAAAVGRRVRQEPQTRPGSGALGWILPVWVLMAVVAFATGGQFHRHYWVTLCPSLSALAAVGLTRVVRRNAVYIATAMLLLPGIDTAVRILSLPRERAVVVASDDERLTDAEQLAVWFHEHRAPGDQMYVMCAGASFYANAGEDPPFPYLWFDNVEQVPGALGRLLLLVQSPGAPRFIALQQPMRNCDRSGRIAAAVRSRYSPVATVDGVPVLERSSGS